MPPCAHVMKLLQACAARGTQSCSIRLGKEFPAELRKLRRPMQMYNSKAAHFYIESLLLGRLLLPSTLIGQPLVDLSVDASTTNLSLHAAESVYRFSGNFVALCPLMQETYFCHLLAAKVPCQPVSTCCSLTTFSSPHFGSWFARRHLPILAQILIRSMKVCTPPAEKGIQDAFATLAVMQLCCALHCGSMYPRFFDYSSFACCPTPRA